MGELDNIYRSADQEAVKAVWHSLIYFAPSIPLLKRRFIKRVLQDYEESFPSLILQHTLFPGVPKHHQTRLFSRAINRGVAAFNELVFRFLPQYYDLIKMGGIGNSGFQGFFHSGHKYLETSDKNIEHRVLAYNCSRAFGIGNLVGRVDSCPDVLRSLIHYDDIIKGLHSLLQVSSQPSSYIPNGEDTGLLKWKTGAGVNLLGQGESPIKSRLKYIDGAQPAYTSIIMKLLRKNIRPEQIGDYIGCEIIVENDKARYDLYNYIRNSTSFSGRVEGFKSSYKRQLSTESNPRFRVVKFNLRFPVPIKIKGKRLHHFHHFERVPVEIQVFTYHEIKRRDDQATHTEYKRTQFFKILPILWPEDIYRPLAEARGITV